MYERADRPGGLLTYGIPGFKLSKSLVAHRFKLLQKAGLKLHLNHDVGRDGELSDLIAANDAVFIGVGATGGRKAGFPGEELPDVVLAMDYLVEKQQQLFGEKASDTSLVTDKRVVVIGGGDTAMDCLRTAIRDGATEVTCLYRRDEANMPGSAKEYQNAIEEGVEFCFNISPREIRHEAGVLCIEVEKTRLGEKAADGRQRVEIIPETAHCIPADVVILALGFDVASLEGLEAAGIETDQWGQLQIDSTSGITSNPKIYSGGDCHRGADFVVTAAADGRRAALAMMRELLG